MRALVVRSFAEVHELAHVSGTDPANPLQKPRESTRNHSIRAGSRLPQHVHLWIPSRWRGLDPARADFGLLLEPRHRRHVPSREFIAPNLRVTPLGRTIPKPNPSDRDASAYRLAPIGRTGVHLRSRRLAWLARPVVRGSVAMGSLRNLSTDESKRVLLTTDVGRTWLLVGSHPSES